MLLRVPTGTVWAWEGVGPGHLQGQRKAAAVSHPVHCSDLRVDSQKLRHPSGGVSASSEMVFELEGVELGADGKASMGAVHGWADGHGACTHQGNKHTELHFP